MTLYSIQGPAVWERIKKDGRWTSDKAYYMFPNEYSWMLSKMKAKLNINNPSDSIIWLWEKRPDLRCSGYEARGKEMVLLEVEIDESKVLASEFEMWHWVLNDTVLEDYEGELIDKEESWERIFDVDRWYEDDYEPIVQYVTGEIDEKYIRFIRTFKCK